jgi:hypothetical protein
MKTNFDLELDMLVENLADTLVQNGITAADVNKATVRLINSQRVLSEQDKPGFFAKAGDFLKGLTSRVGLTHATSPGQLEQQKKAMVAALKNYMGSLSHAGISNAVKLFAPVLRTVDSFHKQALKTKAFGGPGTAPAAPGGTPAAPGGTPPAPGGTPPGGTPPAPGGTPPAPGGTPPGGTPPAPGGTPPAPGGTPAAPGGTPPAPGGTPPGGTPPAPGGTPPGGTPPAPAAHPAMTMPKEQLDQVKRAVYGPSGQGTDGDFSKFTNPLAQKFFSDEANRNLLADDNEFRKFMKNFGYKFESANYSSNPYSFFKFLESR